MLILLSKYWLVEVIENDCIVTRVGLYNEILPEPSGNPSGSDLGLRQVCVIMSTNGYLWVLVVEFEVIMGLLWGYHGVLLGLFCGLFCFYIGVLLVQNSGGQNFGS